MINRKLLYLITFLHLRMQFAILGGGSWATALAKILTDNNHCINWWIRNNETIQFINKRRHNPHYLSSTYFNTNLLKISDSIEYVIDNSDVIIVAIPSAFASSAMNNLPENALDNKKVVSAIKGILPEKNQLLHEYLKEEFNAELSNYFSVLGPCHAEEVAVEKLSYLTFSGVDKIIAHELASHFSNSYIRTEVNPDIMGVQYAAVIKNIYALGAGIAHGLDYGDNFLSVYIANSANEMVRFLRVIKQADSLANLNYAASVYLGDLLVTCYSLYSRNRMFGNMIGRGYSVKAAQLELNMIAEGYNASKCIHIKNEDLKVEIPIADIIYKILWQQLPAAEGFEQIETLLV